MMARVNMVRDAGQLNHCMMPVLLVPERSRRRHWQRICGDSILTPNRCQIWLMDFRYWLISAPIVIV